MVAIVPLSNGTDDAKTGRWLPLDEGKAQKAKTRTAQTTSIKKATTPETSPSNGNFDGAERASVNSSPSDVTTKRSSFFSTVNPNSGQQYSHATELHNSIFTLGSTSRHTIQSGQPMPKWWCYIAPEHWFCHAWSMIVIVLMIYTGTVIPYRLCFVHFRIGGEVVEDDDWTVAGYIVDCLFWMDLVFNFLFAYYDTKGHLVCHPWQIAKNYLRGWFLFDLLACLPPELFVSFAGAGLGGNVNKTLRLTRLGRILRIAKFVRIVRVIKLAKGLRHNPIIRRCAGWGARWIGNTRLISCIKFIVRLTFILHILACMWYLVAALESEEELENTWVYRREIQDDSHYRQWLTGIYFILTVITTVGFGDIGPLTNAEIMYVLFLMLVGAVVNSLVISEVITIFQNIDDVSIAQSRKHRCINDFQHISKFSEDAKIRLLKHIEHNFVRASGSDNKMTNHDSQCLGLIFEEVPYNLQEKVAKEVYDGRLCHNSFFRVCSHKVFSKKDKIDARFVAATAAYLQPLFFDVQEMIYKCGEVPTGIFFVLSGTLALVAEASHKGGINRSCAEGSEGLTPFQLISSRSYAGDAECLSFSKQVRRYNLRSESESQLLHLPRRAFFSLLKSAPEKHEQHRRIANNAKHSTQRRLARHTLGHHDYMALAVSTIQLHMDRCIANVRGRHNGSSPENLKVTLKPAMAFNSAGRDSLHHAVDTAATSKLDQGNHTNGQKTQNKTVDDQKGTISAVLKEEMKIEGDIQGMKQDIRDLRKEFRRQINDLKTDQSKMMEAQSKMNNMLQQLYVAMQAGPTLEEGSSQDNPKAGH